MFNPQRASDSDAPLAVADVKPLAADDAVDQVLVEGLVSVINAAYAVGEAGFWRIGRELVCSAEALTRSRGRSTMQLELLVPVGWTHPEKVKLRSWYTRLGYEEVRSAPFEEVAAHLAPQLAAPSDFLIFRKRRA